MELKAHQVEGLTALTINYLHRVLATKVQHLGREDVLPSVVDDPWREDPWRSLRLKLSDDSKVDSSGKFLFVWSNN